MDKLHIKLCVTISLFASCAAFLANPFSARNVNDYTHTDITELGILAAVGKEFEENPVQGCACTPGSLSGIPDITARKLYDAYYGGQVSEKRFQEAIDDIVKQNNKVDQDHYREAVWHFNGEKIHEGNMKMQLLRDTAIKILNRTSPNLDAAREVVGQYLHLLQMFYSNTNWIEMSGQRAYIELGITGKHIMAPAPATFDTCRSCGVTLHTPCVTNLIVTANLLTSGYRSGQDAQKPPKDPTMYQEGKCSHGGSSDTSANTAAALGGINKESLDPTYSPHSHLHEKAALAAIEHTAYFFGDTTYGIRGLLGDEIFEDLLQLRAGNSMVFVIDTTGSMGLDVQAIIQKTKEIVRETAGTDNAPYNYILVTFNDPGNMTTVQKTKNATDIITWLGNIVVHGGDDCPEFSLTGIQAAATVANPNSQVFVFTDATPKDADKINYISSLISEKKLRVQFLLTGTCARRRRRTSSHRTSFTAYSLKDLV